MSNLEAAEGCDLLMLLQIKINRSQPSAAQEMVDSRVRSTGAINMTSMPKADTPGSIRG
jgi:hypothetical protein